MNDFGDFYFWVKCDSCEARMNICGTRPKGQKFDIGESYRCIPCQRVSGVEPVFVDGYTGDAHYRYSGPVNGNDANRYRHKLRKERRVAEEEEEVHSE